MTDDELREWISKATWSNADRQKLVDEWNERRSDLGRIGMNQVRSSCRLKNVIGSMTAFLNQNKAVDS
jgi:hypothetical protein